MAYRTSQAAGRFFPAEAEALAALMGNYAERTTALRDLFCDTPRAIIAPHAGYGFSGGLAAGAWAATARATPARIAILSPAHRHAFDGIAVPTGHGAVALPGKRVKIDKDACKALIRARKALGLDEAFEAEHGIDTQLPFARTFHPKVPVVPVVIGNATAGQVAAVIDRLEKMEGETLFVLSSDLSHFLTQDQAVRIDAQTAGLIETGQGERLTPAHACGARALAGWFASRPGRDSRPVRLGQFTSFNTSADASRVVGYGAWALFHPGVAVVPLPMRRDLLRVARQAITARAAKGKSAEIALETFPMPLRTMMASFVTLVIDGTLRGCVGSFTPHRALVADVADNAVRAAFGDQRFRPLKEAEISRLDIGISVLTRPVPVEAPDEAALLSHLVPGETGLILADGDRRALFLPSVWDKLPEPGAFVAALRRKAGLAPDHWPEGMTARVFRAERFGEAEFAAAAAA